MLRVTVKEKCVRQRISEWGGQCLFVLLGRCPGLWTTRGSIQRYRYVPSVFYFHKIQDSVAGLSFVYYIPMQKRIHHRQVRIPVVALSTKCNYHKLTAVVSFVCLLWTKSDFLGTMCFQQYFLDIPFVISAHTCAIIFKSLVYPALHLSPFVCASLKCLCGYLWKTWVDPYSGSNPSNPINQCLSLSH